MLQSTFAAMVYIAQQHADLKMIISGDHALHLESDSQPLVGKRLNTFFDQQNVIAWVINSMQNVSSQQGKI